MVSGGYSLHAEKSDVRNVEILSRRSRQNIIFWRPAINRKACIDTLCASLKDIYGDARPYDIVRLGMDYRHWHPPVKGICTWQLSATVHAASTHQDECIASVYTRGLQVLYGA